MQIDGTMMSELQGIQKAVNPSDTLLVVDAMTGQEAAGLVKAFNDAAPLSGRFREATLSASTTEKSRLGSMSPSLKLRVLDMMIRVSA